MRVRKVDPVQRELPLPPLTPSKMKVKMKLGWGGRRPGAGRRRRLLHDPPHCTRPVHHARHPVHITTRVMIDVGRLRTWQVMQVFQQVAQRVGSGASFRVVHASIQCNHLHLISEGADARAIARGIQRFLSMVARRINALLGRRGKVFAHRYSRVDITTPRQARNTLAYVLNNWRRHREDVTTVGAENEQIDPYSTAWAFDGWSDLDELPPWARIPSAEPRTWLLRVGWRRGGPPISVREVPGRQARQPRQPRQARQPR